MAHSLDYLRPRYIAAGGSDYGVYDYVVGNIAAGEWMQYTRTFPTGNYEVYLRQGLANMATGESVLEEVLGDPTKPNAETRVLGSFLGLRTGFQFGNFPLTDGAGLNKIILKLSGTKTFRLRQITPDPSDGARYLNYLIFVPTTGPGIDRATVASLSPSPGETRNTVTPVINAVIQNRTTSVKVETVKLELNGRVVDAIVTPTATGATVRYEISPVPPSGALNNAKLTFKDSDNVEIAVPWQFTITYLALDPANRKPGPGKDRGFNVRVVIADPNYGPYENSLERAEQQLAQPSTIPSLFNTNLVVQLM
ncbi:MAG: hypothetical protein N3G20_08035, partial [Verrucomicrobiae bacterium]|nr:hypothetical protein [Verrucomicrobiae bacterium]